MEARIARGRPVARPAGSVATASARAQELRRIMEVLTFQMRIEGVDPPSRIGLQSRELSIVARLALTGPTSLKALIADLAMPPSTMTALVDRLAEGGYMRRGSSAEDRRLVVLEATPRARVALEESTRGFTAVATRMLDALNEAEQDSLLRLLRRVAGRLTRTE